LVDVGFSFQEIRNRLKDCEVDPSELDGIIITHEHTDHIKGLGVLVKRLNLPVFMTNGTWKIVETKYGCHVSDLHTFSPGEDFHIKEIGFESFSVLHDAADPVGFCFSRDGLKVGIATDLGKVTNLVRESLKGVNCLILESNHDPGMLYRGPYPWWLKQRIKGRFGHLSNEDSAGLLTDLLHNELKHVVMAHISQTNNQMEMVHLNAMKVLQNNDYGHVQVHMASQNKALRPIEIV